jgi:tetratricopeptide (TPR) repeat protein
MHNPLCYAVLLEARGIRASCAGDPFGAYQLLARAAELAERAGAWSQAAVMIGNTAAACVEGGRYAEAAGLARRTLELAERLRLPNIAALAHANLGYASFAAGDLGAADTHLEQSIAAFAAQGDLRLEATIRAGRARVHALAGRLAEAEADAARVLAVDVAPSQRALALGVLAGVLHRTGRAAEAAARAAEAMAIVRDLGGLEEHESLVRLAFAETRAAPDDAAAALAEARRRVEDRATRMTDPAWREAFLLVPENARTLAQ